MPTTEIQKSTPYQFLHHTLLKLKDMEEDKPDLENKRIMALKQLHLVGKKSEWLIGELLIQQDQILKERYTAWKNSKAEGSYNQPKSVYPWVEDHQKEIGFGVKMAQRYIRLREETDPEIGDRIGVKKNDIIRTLPKPHQDKIRKRVVEEEWSATKVQEVVDRIRNKEKKMKNFKTVIRPQLPKVHVLLNRSDRNVIVIKINRDYRDLFNQILQEKYLLKIQEEVFFLSQNAE